MQRRKTIQKQFVIDALHELGNHPTAQDIHGRIQEKYHGVSLATVYSNLKNLAEEGEVRVLSFSGRSDRYDGNMQEHYHIRCQNCGDFCDLPTGGITEINNQIAEVSGYEVKGYEILFNGICPGCQKTEIQHY